MIQYKIYIILVILDWFCWPTLIICPKMSKFMLETHVLSTIMTCRLLHICPQESTNPRILVARWNGCGAWVSTHSWDARSESACVFFFQQNAMVIKWHFHVFSWDDPWKGRLFSIKWIVPSHPWFCKHHHFDGSKDVKKDPHWIDHGVSGGRDRR